MLDDPADKASTPPAADADYPTASRPVSARPDQKGYVEDPDDSTDGEMEPDPTNVCELLSAIRSNCAEPINRDLITHLSQGPAGIDLLAAFDAGRVAQFVTLEEVKRQAVALTGVPAGLGGVCRIRTNVGGDTTWGTGFLIRPRIVLTAGHLLFKKGKRASTIKVWASNGTTPLPVDAQNPADAAAGWKNGDNCAHDYGIIRLAQDAGAPPMAVGVRPTASIFASLTGFPANSATATTNTGFVGNPVTCGIGHSIPATGGHSGAPIYIMETLPSGTRPIVIAIQTRNLNLINVGVKIDVTVCAALSQWAGGPMCA